MKKTLIVLCSAVALVGCDRNRGGAGKDSNRDTGFGASHDTTYPSSRSANDSPVTNISPGANSALSPSTNSAVIAPGADNSSGTYYGTDTPKQDIPKDSDTPKN